MKYFEAHLKLADSTCLCSEPRAGNEQKEDAVYHCLFTVSGVVSPSVNQEKGWAVTERKPLA